MHHVLMQKGLAMMHLKLLAVAMTFHSLVLQLIIHLYHLLYEFQFLPLITHQAIVEPMLFSLNYVHKRLVQ